MPLTAEGYKRYTYDEILQKQILRAQELWGSDIDTSDKTPLGKYIRLNVHDFAQIYEENEQIYYARFPNTAEGQSLDRLMPFAMITRNPPTPARHIVTIYGEQDTVVPVGFLVDTDDDVTFYLVNEVTIGEDGTVDGLFEAEVAGETGNVAVGDIKNIVNPVLGIDSIVHKSIDTIARDTETDIELRERFSSAIAGAGSGTANAIRGEIMRINGVYGCIIEANETEETDSKGRPPHTFQVFVLADESLNQAIGEAIFRKKPIGIQTYGETSVTVTDDGGFQHTIKFSKTSEKVVAIKVQVSVNALFESDGQEQIKNNLVNHINSLANGENVILSSLYTYIHAVEGVVETKSLLISIDSGEFKEQNVICQPNEAARTSLGAVTVEVVR